MLQLLQDIAFVATVATCFIWFVRGLRSCLERRRGRRTVPHDI
jgi:hypothetical protein